MRIAEIQIPRIPLTLTPGAPRRRRHAPQGRGERARFPNNCQLHAQPTKKTVIGLNHQPALMYDTMLISICFDV
jgi:hypothetical protein